MEMEEKKPFCPILDVDGVISGGKQFDLDITLPDVYKKKVLFVIVLKAIYHAFSICIIK